MRKTREGIFTEHLQYSRNYDDAFTLVIKFILPFSNEETVETERLSFAQVYSS